jgi:hypothetical protein
MIEPRGWFFYYGRFPKCRIGAERFYRILHARGFGLAPLQTPWVHERLGLTSLDEMKVLTHTNQVLGGADALIYLAGQVWWAWPLSILCRLPGMRALIWDLYRWIARNRYCLGGTCQIHSASNEMPVTLGACLINPGRTAKVIATSPAHIPWRTWGALIGIAVGGSCIFGGTLAPFFPEWNFLRGALWITLSAGLSWCIFIPTLSLISRQNLAVIFHASLVTMAYGEAVLVTAAAINLVLYGLKIPVPAAAFNLAAVGLSNVVMLAGLALPLSGLGIRLLTTIFTWFIFLNGSGVLFFRLFRGWLLGGPS